MVLHTFGWDIVFDVDENGKVLNAYPARVKYRGFIEKTNTNGYMKISEYLKENADELLSERK